MPKENVNCAVVIALKEEFKTISEYLGVQLEPVGPDKPSFFKFGFLDHTSTYRTGVITLLGDMGPTKANSQTQLLLEHWKPNLLLNIGIAGALDSDLSGGDIAVATLVDEYLSKAKAVPSSDAKSFDLEFAGDARVCTDSLVKLVDSLEFSRNKEFKAKFVAKSRQYASTLLPGDIFASLKAEGLVKDEAVIYSGPIASGPIVGAAGQFVDQLKKKKNRKFIALEMEAAGFMNAADTQPAIPRLVLRGISDLSDDRKDAMEKLSNGAVRKLAMANVLSLTKLLLEYFPDYERSSAPSSQQGGPRDLAQMLRTLASEKFLGGTYWNQIVGMPVQAVDRLFSYITRLNEQQFPAGEVLDRLIEHISNSRHPYPLRIRGSAGTGKTLLLQALYQYYWGRWDKGLGNYIPVLIDIKYYDVQDPNDLILQFQSDILRLKELLEKFPEQPIILFIDSIDQHAAHREKLELEIVRLLSRRKFVKRVVAIGLDSSFVHKRSITTALNDAENTSQLLQFKKTDGDLQDFIDAVASLREDVTPHDRKQANRLVHDFGMNELDFLTASIILEKAAAPSFDQVQSLADFYELFCTEYLQGKGVSSAGLEHASTMAHAHIIQRQPADYRDSRLWNLIYYHPSIQHFLIARYVISTLKSCANNGEIAESTLNMLNFVYPQPIDKFCKEIMSRDLETEMACVDGAKKIMDSLTGKKFWQYLKAATHICYLLGRVKTHEAIARALGALHSHLRDGQKIWQGVLSKNQHQAKIKPYFLYERTIYISLVYLGDKDASNTYLHRLLTDQNSDMLNRGFHLEYYQDIEYIPDADQMVHQDNLKGFSKTYKALKTRLQRSGAGSELFEIELYTILSLVQNRHAAGKLDEELRNDVRALARDVSRNIKNAELKAYMSMMEKILAAPAFPIGSVMERFYRLKTVKRKGWVTRGIQDGESVSDHTLGCLILARFLLPEKPPSTSGNWKDYDKEKIMRYLLIHDFAEVFTGDLLPHERDDRARADERAWFSYFNMLSTFSDLHGLQSIEEDWEDFERKASINGQIAAEIDKLENLAQLYIYKRQGKEIEDFEKFQDALVAQIETYAGQQILTILKAWFESGLPLTP